jgi:phage-related protein
MAPPGKPQVDARKPAESPQDVGQSNTVQAGRGYSETCIGIQVLEYRVQLGGTPTDFKPIASVGSGAYEIRVRDVAGTFRTVYVTKFDDSIYVLHAFQKKTQKTAKVDLDLARRRYKLIPGAKP